jgi:ABC-2 type transport system permease protein
MKTAIAFAKTNFKNAIQYRGPILVWALSSILALLGLSFFWIASQINPATSYSKSDLLTYYFLGILIGHTVRFYVSEPLKIEIQEGTINTLLVKPVNYLWSWLGRVFGWKMCSNLPWILLTIPFYLLFHNNLNLIPQGNLLAFVIGMIFSAMLSFLISFSIGLSAFWFTETGAFNGVFWILFYLFGGRIVPLDFFPTKLKTVANFLPFRYMFAFPIEVYLGKVTGGKVLWGLLIEIGWSLGLLALVKKLWQQGLRVYGAFGG